MSQAGQVGTNLQFLNLIFQNPNSKCLLGCAQTPYVLHPVDAGCAFLRNASIACQCTLSLKIPNAFWCKRQWRSHGIRGKMNALCA